MYSENFDPQLYLSRCHRDTPAKDLELGERALKADLQNRKEQLKKLVKDNFDCFISCKNTIDGEFASSSCWRSFCSAVKTDKKGRSTIRYSRHRRLNKMFFLVFQESYVRWTSQLLVSKTTMCTFHITAEQRCQCFPLTCNIYGLQISMQSCSRSSQTARVRELSN
jgi:hypothetical protein